MSMPVQTTRSETAEIYPREGTETIPLKRCLISVPVEIYPREGTETNGSVSMGTIKEVEI